MGFRGIPARYGGFETFAQEICPWLSERGHEVTVYCRSNAIDYREKYFKGVRLIILPTIRYKYFDTLFHTFISVIHSLFCGYDIVLMMNAANAPFCVLSRFAGQKVLLNVDGIERMRKKWNVFGKFYCRICEYFSIWFPNKIISDANIIKDYYLKKYNKKSIMIPYGAYIVDKVTTKDVLEKFSLKSKEYILYVSRLEPENNAHIVIEAFKKIKTDKKLVIVGDAPYAANYKKYIKANSASDSRIIFTGFIFGDGYKELQANAYCYIQATEIGGTHPVLIEAMGFGNCVIANGTPENIEVAGNAGLIYEKNNVNDLADKIQHVIDNEGIVKLYGINARERIQKYYSWDMVKNKYEELFKDLLNVTTVR